MVLVFDKNQLKENLIKLASPSVVDDVLRTLGESISILRRNQDIKHHYSPDEIRSKLDEIVGKAKKGPQEKIPTSIGNGITELLKTFERELGNWIFLIPVENLKISTRRFKIIGIQFYQFDDSKREKFLKLYRRLYRSNPKLTSEQIAARLRRDASLLDLIKDKTVAEVHLQGRLERLKNIALDRVSLALDCLKLYRYTNDDFYGRYFGIVGEVISSQVRFVLAFRPNFQLFSESWERVGYLYPYDIDKERVRFIRKAGLPKLNHIIGNIDSSDLHKRIVTATRLFGRAFDVPLYVLKERSEKQAKPEPAELLLLGERLLKDFMTLESLFIFDQHEAIGSNLAERVALWLGEDYEGRLKIYRFVKAMYEKRSALVHHGEHDLDLEDVKGLTYYVQISLLKMIADHQKMHIHTEEELRNWFMERKFK